MKFEDTFSRILLLVLRGGILSWQTKVPLKVLKKISLILTSFLNITEYFPLLLLQCYIPNHCVASTCWLWYYTSGQTTNLKTKHGSQSIILFVESNRKFNNWRSRLRRGRGPFFPSFPGEKTPEKASSKASAESQRSSNGNGCYDTVGEIFTYFRFDRCNHFRLFLCPNFTSSIT